MRRILRAALAVFLLLLCIADIGLWIRGYWLGDTLIYRSMPNPTAHRFIQFWTASGGLRIMRGSESYPLEGAQLFSWETGFHHDTYGGQKYPTEIWSEGEQWGGLGFYYYRLESPQPHFRRSYRGITIPHALPALLLALYPIKFLWVWRRRRTERIRQSRGLCVHCAYDLRGIPKGEQGAQGAQGGRCPECGTSLPLRQLT